MQRCTSSSLHCHSRGPLPTRDTSVMLWMRALLLASVAMSRAAAVPEHETTPESTINSIDAQGVPMSSIKASGVHDETMQGKSQRHNKISSASKSADARAQIGCTGDLRTSLPSNDLSGEGQNFWPNKNGNINCSGASPFQSNVDVSKGPSWTFKDETASIVSSHPCIDDDMNIYLIHRNGKLRKFSLGGRLLWTNTVNHEASQGNGQFAMSGPALMNGLIYLGTADGFVTSVNMSNGVTHWRVKATIGGVRRAACCDIFPHVVG